MSTYDATREHETPAHKAHRDLGPPYKGELRLSGPVREVCILATAREFNNAFEWAAHEPEALRVGYRRRSFNPSS